MVRTGRKLIGITEAAAIIGVHPNTLRSWCERGLVPHVKLPSGYRRFDPEVLERLVDEMQEGGADAPKEMMMAA